MFKMKLVLLRHGQSIWNKKHMFTGWTDVDLSETGIKEAERAGKILKENNFEFDIAFTSYLKRAIKTIEIVLRVMKHKKIPIVKSWRLNERHYGALQGLTHAEMEKQVGREQVFIWRRSYDVRPPALTRDDKRWPGNDPLYKDVPKKELPFTECLKDTVERVMPYWEKRIVPELKKGKKIIISAHGNSLRALIKYLDNVSDEEITRLNIATGIPLIYELDSNLKPLKHYYLASEEEVKRNLEQYKK